MPRSGAALLLEANVGKPLLDVLRDLMLDPDEQAAFADDPSRYLAQYGYEDVEADHLSEAFSLVADTLPPDVAQAVADTAPVATAAPVDPDDGSGGAPDTTINPDEDAFGGVDEGFDTVALNGLADVGADVTDAGTADTDGELGGPDTSGAVDGDRDASGGFGTGELDLDGVADDPGLADVGLDGGDTVAFGVGSEGTEGADDPSALAEVDGGGSPFLQDDAEAFALDDLDDGDTGVVDDGFDDSPAFEGDADDGAPVDDVDVVDDGPVDDPSFDDIGSF
ncbi:MAG TPA: hypothetical protein VGO78_20975 [Acidimicrobiales bacterium]|nr:hypothetical protein [Acidimicrobiales bacterium]